MHHDTNLSRFSPSGPFTNALLHNTEITALIRDTEPHERGLFSTRPGNPSNIRTSTKSGSIVENTASRRTTSYDAPSQSSVVARVLGSDLLRKIQSSGQESKRDRRVNIDILLQGAEKLCAAFPLEGASTRINAIRDRHDLLVTSIKHWDDKLGRQQLNLNSIKEPASAQYDANTNSPSDDLKAEEEAILKLESKKADLEARVAALEHDLDHLRV